MTRSTFFKTLIGLVPASLLANKKKATCPDDLKKAFKILRAKGVKVYDKKSIF